jgi:hypothetical protein
VQEEANAGTNNKICKLPSCGKFFKGNSGNHKYCSEECKHQLGTSTNRTTNQQKRLRTESGKSLEKMTKEELIDFAVALQIENKELSDRNQIIQDKLDKIHIKIGEGTLDWIFKTESAGPKEGFLKPRMASYASVTKKPVTILAKLNPDEDTSNLNGDSMDKFFRGQKDSPILQNFTKKDNVARLVFNSEADAKKATEILRADSKLGQTVQSITERKTAYPVVVYGTGIENLTEMKKEIEFRNEILHGNIISIRILSRNKGHIRMYVSSKKCQMEILNVGVLYTKLEGEFKSHKVKEMNLNMEVKNCFKCQKEGHIAFHCPDKSDTHICGRCTGTHKTQDCVLDESKLKCVNCGGKHKSGDAKCPNQIRAVEKLKKRFAQ